MDALPEWREQELDDTWRRDALAASEWARALLGRTDFVIFDTESTGLGIDAEIVQVGVLSPDGRPLLDTHIKPQGEIEHGASLVHGITAATVAGAPGFSWVWPQQLREQLLGRTVVVYNASYDRNLLKQVCKRHGFDLPADIDWQCAMEWYAQFVGEWSEYHGSYRWQKLPRSAHTAIDDCRACLALIRHMAQLGEHIGKRKR